VTLGPLAGIPPDPAAAARDRPACERLSAADAVRGPAGAASSLDPVARVLAPRACDGRATGRGGPTGAVGRHGGVGHVDARRSRDACAEPRPRAAGDRCRRPAARRGGRRQQPPAARLAAHPAPWFPPALRAARGRRAHPALRASGAGAPRYDLALLAPRVLGAPAEEVAAGPEREVPVPAPNPLPTRVFWGVLVAAVVVLLALVCA